MYAIPKHNKSKLKFVYATHKPQVAAQGLPIYQNRQDTSICKRDITDRVTDFVLFTVSAIVAKW